MKKNLFTVFALLAALCLVFIACKPEPDPEPDPDVVTNWVGQGKGYAFSINETKGTFTCVLPGEMGGATITGSLTFVGTEGLVANYTLDNVHANQDPIEQQILALSINETAVTLTYTDANKSAFIFASTANPYVGGFFGDTYNKL
jgi:hypothetical protein